MKALTARGGARRRAVDAFKRWPVVVLGLFCACASLFAAPGPPGVAGAALAVVMLAIAVADWRFFIIPDELSLLAAAIGIVDLFQERAGEMPIPILDALVRGATIASVFLAFRLVYRRLRGYEGMGLGDVKLAGVAGIWLDWASLPIAVEVAALGALGFVLAQHIRADRALDPLAKLPFGAFFAPAIWCCWLFARWWN
jgi:leader peptidase (prepilin peptidase) / N-methyltransferase